jgi:hypothetical protein
LTKQNVLFVYAVLQGGMMEEWHQKLHNNSSPDDLVICQALLDYLASGQDMQVYWDSLAAQGALTKHQFARFCGILLVVCCNVYLARTCRSTGTAWQRKVR